MDLPQLDRENTELVTQRAVSDREQKIAVLVLGMHRSGTSALALTLNFLGLPIGRHLMLSGETNRKDYFENERLVAFNNRLLQQFGSRWDDPLPLRQECFLSPTAQSAVQDLAEILRAEFGEEPAVVIKDPRLCRLTPIWKEALGHVKRRTFAVLPLRHPLEVAASLEANDSLAEAPALAIWLQQVLAAERDSRGLPRSFILYDDLLRDWRGVARKMRDTLGLEWPRDPESAAGEIDAFLSSEPRRRHSAPEDLSAEDAIKGFCSRAWAALSSPGVSPAEEAALDQITQELTAALDALSPLIGALHRDSVRRREREEERDPEFHPRRHPEKPARSQIDRCQDRERRVRSEAERYELAFETPQKRLDALQARIDALQRQLDGILSSTVWRATWPLRFAAERLPRPARRALRGGAELLWWTATLRVREKLADRRRRIAERETPPGLSSAAENRQGGLGGVAITEAAAVPADPAARGFLKAMAAPTIAKAIERLKRFPLFSLEDYLRLNPDIAAAPMDPHAHFLCLGAFEGRRWCGEDRIARKLGECISGANGNATPAETGVSPAREDSKIAALAARCPPVGIYVSSQGNIFMNEIAVDVAADLESLGVRVSLGDETSQSDHRPPLRIFVAPHEFFQLGRGREWVREDLVANSFMFQVEQIQTQWYRLGLPLSFLARGVIDFTFENADLLGRTGLPALHYTPGLRPDPPALFPQDYFHPLFQVLPAAAKAKPNPESSFAERPLDIAFSGNLTPHRSRFFARHAAFLSDYEAYIHCPVGTGPYTTDLGAVIRLANHVLGHAKIALNIHRDEFPYFEWQRIVQQGMRAGSVVVSEPCLPQPDFKAGVHYFEEDGQHMPDLIEWLLRTEEGRRNAERVRTNVQTQIGDEKRKRQNAAKLLEFLLQPRAT